MSVLRASPYIASWRQRYPRGKLAPVARVPVRQFHSTQVLSSFGRRTKTNGLLSGAAPQS